MSLSRILKKYKIARDRVIPNMKEMEFYGDAAEVVEFKKSKEEELKAAKMHLEEGEKRIADELLQQEENRALVEEECAKRKQEAEEQSLQIIKSAQEEKLAIQKQAEQQAKDIVADAESKNFDLKKAAHKEGFHEGLAEGNQQGIEEGKKEVEALGKTLQDIIVEINNKRSEIVAKAEPKVVDLSMAIAKKIIQTEVAENKSVIRELVSESLKRLRTRERAIVKVHADDLENLREYKNELMSIIDGIEDLDIVADAKVDRGGCIVETESTTIDSRIETRLNKIKQEVDNLK